MNKYIIPMKMDNTTINIQCGVMYLYWLENYQPRIKLNVDQFQNS